MHRDVIARPARLGGDGDTAGGAITAERGVGRGWGPLPGSRQALGHSSARRTRGGEDDPRRIDWAARQAAAVIPFAVVDGRPVNPLAPTGTPRGRGGLWHLGEGLAADAAVLATGPDGVRRLLLVERGDGHGWALPGGHIDPGEQALEAAIRELAEETGLRLPGAVWTVLPPRVVDDPRATDEAWMVTTPCVTDLGEVAELPRVSGDDDAADAAWIRADDYATLTADLADRDGVVFPAHVALIREVLEGNAR
ncbi:NUDIX hydrolase [Actinomadura logoneensis]|uniref:NUDIX hydrolase n=2 Tax=Actinomadura logoneensis TaxID=2293572 RepID=A0A372JTD1_9ACTN|nr:NUDIX hydrolase [Actinomadura logoneensis]